MRNHNTVILAAFLENILEIFVDYQIEFRTEFTGTTRVNGPNSISPKSSNTDLHLRSLNKTSRETPYLGVMRLSFLLRQAVQILPNLKGFVLSLCS